MRTVSEQDPSNARASRGSIARKALLALGLPTALVCSLSMLFAASAPEATKGVIFGHLLAQLSTGIWIGGALLTFHRSDTVFFAGTIGLAPLRFLVVLGATVVCSQLLAVDLMALGLSLVLTLVYGHGVEVLAFTALSQTVEGAPNPPPAKDLDAEI
jgi:NhaP-type Na+/H+ and K+/H+ antiporter